MQIVNKMMQKSLSDYRDAYTFMKVSIAVAGQALDAIAIAATRSFKQTIFENCAFFTGCIREINNTQVDNEKNLDFVIPKYNLIECSNNYQKVQCSNAKIITIITLQTLNPSNANQYLQIMVIIPVLQM